MTREPDDFTPDTVEEQLDEVARHLRERNPARPESPTEQVVADLEHLYDQQARSEAEALQRVRRRLLRTPAAARYLQQAQTPPTAAPRREQPWRTLGQQGALPGGRGVAPVHSPDPRRNGTGTRPGFRRERQDLMLRIFRIGQRYSARTITLVAVALLIVLVGGLVLGLLLVHQANHGTPAGPQNHATAIVTSTPAQLGAYHEFPLPPVPASSCLGNGCGPHGITSGPDGHLWFTAYPLGIIGRITPAGSVQEFTLPNTCGNVLSCGPYGITSGPDGNLWFTEYPGNSVSRIGRITPAGKVQEFALPTTCGSAQGCSPLAITRGPDGNLWFTEQDGNRIGRITPAGVISEFALPTTCGNLQGCGPLAITRGPDGNLWFTESTGNRIGRITPAGKVQEFALPTTCGGNGCYPQDITSGPDGNLWFTEFSGNRIGRITPTGSIQEFAFPTTCGGNGCSPYAITSGPDGNLWFTSIGSTIGRITSAGDIQLFTLQSACMGCAFAGITSGPDGHLWFTENGADAIGEVSP